MLGLAIIFCGLLYLLISIFVIYYAVKKANQKGIAGWKWGLPTAFAMYLLVFWDHLPTLLMHKHYCDKYSGLKSYISLNEWKKENPGIAKTLIEEKSKSIVVGDKVIYRLNQRFNSVTYRKSTFLTIEEIKQQIVDSSNDEVITEYIDYISGGNFQNANSIKDYKFWLVNKTCEPSRKGRTQFSNYLSKFTKIGEEA